MIILRALVTKRFWRAVLRFIRNIAHLFWNADYIITMNKYGGWVWRGLLSSEPDIFVRNAFPPTCPGGCTIVCGRGCYAGSCPEHGLEVLLDERRWAQNGQRS